jgi:hypothetical protein
LVPSRVAITFSSARIATAADHLPDVRLADLKMQLDEVAVELLGHHDRARIVNELLRDVLEHRAHA